jgi:NAD(P)H-hydrate epimerase
MKVLTAAQMREVDRRTTELGIPGIVLMENAGIRVVEFLAEKFAPLAAQRIVVLCGKGNNGGDGMVVARQLYTRFRMKALHVVLLAQPAELKGDAAGNFRMLEACGCPVYASLTRNMLNATIVIDALLGTGLHGPATGPIVDAIDAIGRFRLAKVVAVDIPSGLPSDSAAPAGAFARADYTVTFTAPKPAHVLAPNCDVAGELRVVPIGSPPRLYERDESIFLSLLEPAMFRRLLAPRPPDSNKGKFGHVLVIAGSAGKTGAAAMSGMAALHAGAGLVTVASAESAVPVIASHAPELMTEVLDPARLDDLARNKTVLAVGPGLGTAAKTVAMVRSLVKRMPQPMVVDADGLNALAGAKWSAGGHPRVLTPHPGEMSRLTGKTVAEIQADRVGTARAFAVERQVTLVLKGYRTAIAFPDGRVWINPTGSPAMAKAGSGDILTGLISGMLAQFPERADQAVAAAVYLHGLAGQLGAKDVGEKSLLATELLYCFPRAVEECARIPDCI